MFSFRITLPFRIPTLAEVRALFAAKPNTTAGIVAGIHAQVSELDAFAATKRAEAIALWRQAVEIDRRANDAHDEFVSAARVRDNLAKLVA